MNKIVFYAFIIVFLSKTGNVFSENNIFDVDNVTVNKINSKKTDVLLETAFKKGFLQLLDKILLSEDFYKLNKIENKKIKSLISRYQIVSKKKPKDKDKLIINLSFDREKMNQFFYEKNISYADISKFEVVLFPILNQNGSVYLFTKNYFYENWNNQKDIIAHEYIEYILPLENLEDLSIINKYKNNLEELDSNILFTDYDTKNNIILVINTDTKKNNIFFKGFIAGKKIIKNYIILDSEDTNEENYKKIIRIAKNEIEEIWKSQNLIDVRTPSFLNVVLDIKNQSDLLQLQKALSAIDVIQSYKVVELTINSVKIKIKYLGKIDKLKNKFNTKKIDVKILNNTWKLNLI
jgi:hypothetical protein